MAQQSSKQTKSQKREAARAEVQRMREEQARKDKRNRMALVVGIVGIVAIAVIAVVVILLQSNYQKNAAPPIDDTTGPTSAATTGGYRLGTDLNPGSQGGSGVPVEFYTDYICPYCGQWEQAYGATLTELAQSGAIDYVVHPIALLDEFSSGDSKYSTRATNAIALVAQYSPAAFYAYHQALFANQPEEGTAGLTNEQLAQIATQAGASNEVAAKIAAGSWEFADWVGADLQSVASKGITSTPHIYIDGKEWKLDSKSDVAPAEQLKAAVEAAA